MRIDAPAQKDNNPRTSGPGVFIGLFRGGFPDDDVTVHQVGLFQGAFDGAGPLHQVGQNHL